MSELKRSCCLLLWQLSKHYCSLRGQYNQRNEQLGAERELLCKTCDCLPRHMYVTARLCIQSFREVPKNFCHFMKRPWGSVTSRND